jgi:hypothetical protein
MYCAQAAAAGVINPGVYSGTGAHAVGTIHGTAWSGCVGPGNIDMNVFHPEITNQNKWRINLLHSDTTNPWNGYIDNINARVVSKTKTGTPPVSVCAFTVTGRADGTFDTAQVAGNNNFTQTLNVNQSNTVPNLTVSNITGCFGFIATGNPASFVGSFKVYNNIGGVTVTP